MVKLTHKQFNFLKVIHANPGIKFRELVIKTGHEDKFTTCSTLIKTLIDRGIVRRTGACKYYQYYVVNDFDLDSIIVYGKERELKVAGVADLQLEEVEGVPLTEEQALYLKSHYKLLPRRRLAERLGITKTKLNMVLIKNNLEANSRGAI